MYTSVYSVAADSNVLLSAIAALMLDIPVWSNDRDYERFPTGVLTTATLLKRLGA